MTGSLGPFATKAKHARLLVGAALALSSRGAPAAELAGLSWQAPAPCPSEAAVRRAVRQWLSAPEGELDFRAIRVVARVRPDPGGFRLEMSFESKGGNGQETLVAEKCQTLADIVALKVALAADPVATLETAEPPPGGRPKKQMLPESEYAVRLAAGGGFGPLPGVGPAISVVGSILFRGARIEVGGGYWFPKSKTYESFPDIGAEFSLLAGMVRACAAPELGPIEFPVCVGLEAGDLRGTGFGVATVEVADRPWVAVVLGPAVAVPLSSHVVLWAEGDAVLGLVRPSGYTVRNLETLYSPAVGAARAWGGLEVRFW